MAKRKGRRLLVAISLIGLAVVMLYPWKIMVVPEWKVRIVDENGLPLVNTGVREVWQHYSIESRGHRQDLITDKEGYVTFSEHTIRAPLAVRIIRTIVNRLNPHGSTGPDAFVLVLSPDYDTFSSNSGVPGQPLPTQIVVKKNR